MTPLIFHIPHAATDIPPDVRAELSLTDAALAHELLVLTDHYTDEIFAPLAGPDDAVIRFPVSRLVVDVERFPDDAREPMSARGMGAVYTHGHDGTKIRASLQDRDLLMQHYYHPHHQALEAAVSQHLDRFGAAHILDCHSYPETAKPYEADQSLQRPEICIGTDPYHSPVTSVQALERVYRAAGYEVLRDTPFAGALVPLAFHGKDRHVTSVMIEIRRDLYMDETTGQRTSGLERLVAVTRQAVADLRSSLS